MSLHRENARLRRRIMANATESDAAASCVANMAEALAESRAEIKRLRVTLDACMASRDALRDWAQECRNQVLYLLAQQDTELGRVADGLGQASVDLLGPNVAVEPGAR